MNIDLITELPRWYIPLCLLLGAVYAMLLYRGDNSFGDTRKWLKQLMAAARFVIVSILAFLLLSPLIRTITREVEKPIIVIAQDDSESLLIGQDSASFRKSYSASMNKLINDLGSRFEIRTFSFGDGIDDKIDYKFNDKQTNISGLIEDIDARFSNRNVGAIILASDGLYNQGSNPLYSFKKLNIPVYTVALGDTAIKKDLLISEVRANRVAYLGNTFPVEIDIMARQCGGERAIVKIMKDSAELFSRNISISGSKYRLKIPVFLDAKEKGIHKYSISVTVLEGELSVSNNKRDLFIEVNESKQKVLILAKSPHPDVAAFKAAIESKRNYDVVTQYIRKYDGNLKPFDLIILHGLPSAGGNSDKLLQDLQLVNASLLYIITPQTTLSQFNKMNTGLTIEGSNNRSNEVQANFSSDFALFTITPTTRNFLSALPPLIAPFGNYKRTAGIYELLHQKIGKVSTVTPLLYFNQDAVRKSAVMTGEGLWKWRLKEYDEKGSHDATDELIFKVVQYLSILESKSGFRVITKNHVLENEPLIFDAELYNESAELINSPDVKIQIVNQNNKSFPFTFSKTDKAYTLNAGYFPVGNYSYRAETKLGGELMVKSGQLSISALQVESSNTVANHRLLYNISERNKGKMVYPDQLDQINSLISARDDIKPVSYMRSQLRDLVNLKWVFAFIVALLSLEWFLRKRSGAY